MHRKTWTELTRDEFFDIAKLRAEVFFVEQRITDTDLDDADRADDTVHYWLTDDLGATAYLRRVRLPEPEYGATACFGRVAVRKDRRGTGLARELVSAVVADVPEPIVIHAQEYIVELYCDFGFDVVGERFFDAGLPHWTMVRSSQ